MFVGAMSYTFEGALRPCMELGIGTQYETARGGMALWNMAGVVI